MIEQTFARRFADAWKRPTPEKLIELLHPDVLLYQPHLPPIRGREAAKAEFERLFRWLPGLHGEVERSCGADGVVFIEWEMRFPIGREPVRIPAVDRFLLRDGLGIEREVYFDQQPLYLALLARPDAWAGFLRYRFGSR
jgi:hypothetical protein